MLRISLALLVVIVGIHAQNTYVVNTPSLIRPGLDMKVLVNILRAEQPVTVTVEIWKRIGPPPPPIVDLPLPVFAVNPGIVAPPPVQVKQPEPLPQASAEEKITETRAVVRQGEPTTLSLQLPETLSGSNFYIRVTGTGGLNFEQQKDLQFSSTSLAVFVQTDKGIYRPGQKVLFRTFAVYSDLKPYNGPIDINVFDAQNNKIKQFNQVVGELGVFGSEFTLSDQPVMGRWRIESRALGITESVSITVEQFVLPKFEVTVDVPSFALVTDPELVGTVEAKYTFGEAVKGSAVLRIRRNFFFPPFNQPQCQEPIVEKTLQLDGKATFRISASELEFLGRGCNGESVRRAPGEATLGFLRATVLRVEANVTESLTGNVQSGSDQVEFSEKQYRLQWLQSNAKNFKPGLWYDAFLKVSMMDGTPIPLNGRQLAVTLNVLASFNDGCGAFNEKTSLPTTPLPEPQNFPEIKMIVPSDGIIFWSNIVPKGSASVTFTARLEGAYNASMRIEKMNSPSDSFIQALLLTPSPRAGQNAEFEILSTAPMGKVIYQIVSRGRTVRTVEIDGGNRTTFFEVVPITSDMAPSAKLVIYTVLSSGEILADSSSFNVEGVYQNSVSVELSQTRAEPGDGVSVVVQSDANSLVNLLAVDQSILLLSSGNDISRDIVERKMSVFDRGSFGGPGFSLFRFPSPFNGGDVSAVFRNAGVTVLTDATLHVSRNCRVALFGRPSVVKSSVTAVAQPEQTVDEGLVQPDRVRKIFPDTWLWANMTSNADGRAVFTATVPDTITSWVAGAFAMNAVTGLGVAPTNPKLEVFLPFFVTLNLPASVVRGEEVVIQAIVFNFLPQDLSVRVTLTRSGDFQNVRIGSNGQTELISIDKRETIQVRSGQGASVFFPIVASRLGSIELAVQAQSGVAADALVRRLRVEPEGVPQEYNIPMLIDLSGPTTSFSQTQQLPFPPNVVLGSERITASVIGDLLGPTVNNLEKLLKMPSGCGEQNMITFAPDVFIMKYLNATSQLTDNIRDKATRFLEQGYQRQLTYQRFDGSFSAFGNNDESGSTWLTALVLKSFWEAKPFTFIDDNVLNRAIDWIVSKQAENGSFPEVGNVIHKEMQGGSGMGLALTAYVLCALSGKEPLSTDINVQSRRSSSISRARSYLETSVSGETDIYSLSIAAFALRLVNSRVADRAFDRLNRLSTVRDGEKFWDIPAPPKAVTTRRNFWVPPGQTRTQNVEATSYALLNIALRGRTTEGLPVVKWLAQQRNPEGGFKSTQDTIVALQALSEFAELIYNPNSNVDVVVSAVGFRQDFSVRPSNALILQSVDIPGRPNSVSVSATGSGTAIAQISVSFNVFSDSQEPSFDIRVNLREETINGFLLETCTTSRLSGESGSGMVVQEVGIPTGFQADIDSIGRIKGLKRTETLDRKVVLYFDEVAAVPVCVSMKVERVGLVAKSQAVPVRVFQYYSPENQETVFYQSQLLRDSSFCDICADCDCRRP